MNNPFTGISAPPAITAAIEYYFPEGVSERAQNVRRDDLMGIRDFVRRTIETAKSDATIAFHSGGHVCDTSRLKSAVVALIDEASSLQAEREIDDWHEWRRKLQEIAFYLLGTTEAILLNARMMAAINAKGKKEMLTMIADDVSKIDFSRPLVYREDAHSLLQRIEKLNGEIQQDQKKWFSVPQERITNELTTANNRLPLIFKQKTEGGITTKEFFETVYNHLTLTADREEYLKNLTPLTFQFLDILAITAKKLNNFDRFFISVDTYMKMRGLKDRKTAKDQIKSAIATLFHVSITYNKKDLSKEEQKKLPKHFPLGVEFRIIERIEKIDNTGNIEIRLSKTFGELLSSAPPMMYCGMLLELNTRLSPNAYSMGKEILVLFNTNLGKKVAEIGRGDYHVIVAVYTLLGILHLPPPRETRRIKEDIISPLERGLTDLSFMGSWGYCLSGGRPIEEGTNTNDYKIFTSLYIKFSFTSYPDISQRIANITKKKERQKRLADARAMKAAKNGEESHVKTL